LRVNIGASSLLFFTRKVSERRPAVENKS